MNLRQMAQCRITPSDLEIYINFSRYALFGLHLPVLNLVLSFLLPHRFLTVLLLLDPTTFDPHRFRVCLLTLPLLACLSGLTLGKRVNMARFCRWRGRNWCLLARSLCLRRTVIICQWKYYFRLREDSSICLSRFYDESLSGSVSHG